MKVGYEYLNKIGWKCIEILEIKMIDKMKIR